MKRTALIYAAMLLCSCIHEFPQEEPVTDNPAEYYCEDILLSQPGSCSALYPDPISLYSAREFIVHPWPNRNAPVEVSSSDTTVILPRLEGDTLRILRRSPGSAELTLESCGTLRQWTVNNHRSLSYDITYDSSKDILGFRLSSGEDISQEELSWMGSRLSITAIWCYKVGYGSNYMNTRYPATTAIDCLCHPGETVSLISLQEQYREVKALYDAEYARETAKDPKHAWSSWSGISMEVVIRQECPQLELAHEKSAESVYGYSLGFKFDHTQIND